MAVKCLLDLYDDLSGPSCVKPIKIVDLQIDSDSLVALSWIHSYSVKLDKLSKCSVFVKNRLHEINELCDKHPIQFSFISGVENPADCITRGMSQKQLLKSSYFTGPSFSTDRDRDLLYNLLCLVILLIGLIQLYLILVIHS